MKNLKFKISFRNKIVLSILFLVIFCAAIYYFAIYNSLLSIKETEDKIIIQKSEQEKRYRNSISQKILVAKMKLVESQLKQVDSIFVNKDRILDFVTTIEGIASADKVEQTINITDSANKESTYSREILTLSAKGNFNNIFVFLEDLESLNYYININTLEIQRSNDNIIMNISAEFYDK
jgi:Tfp pilus assembly protein PilO